MGPVSHRRQKHLAAAQHPESSRLLAALRRDWHQLSPAGRGPRIRELLGLGCTLRGLAADLEVTEGALRYDLKMADRPAVDARKPRQARPTPPRRGVRHGPKAAAKAEEAAKRILAWLEDELPKLSRPYREQLLDETRRILWSAERAARQAAAAPPSNRPRGSYREVIAACRPAPAGEELWLGLHARWLARWLWQVYPDPEVRDAALKQVERSPIPEKPRPAGRR